MLSNSNFDINCYKKYVQILENMDSKSKNTGGGGNYQGVNIGDYQKKGQRDPEARIELVKSVYNFNNKVVVDIGCNSGEMLFNLSKQIKQGVGLDFDPYRINMCNIKKRIEGHSHLSFYTFDLNNDSNVHMMSLLPQHIDIVFLLSVCNQWFYPCNKLINIIAKCSDNLLIEINGNNKEKTVEYIKTKYSKVINITDPDKCEDCKDRQLFFCTERILTNYGNGIVKQKGNNIIKVFKSNNSYQNEKLALQTLKDSYFIPQFKYNDNEKSITMNYSGENINDLNIPKDFQEQCSYINDYMKVHNIYHNDIHPNNVLVREDGSLCLIDFEHSTINKPLLRNENKKLDEPLHLNNDVCYIKDMIKNEDEVIPKLFHNMWLDKKDLSSNKYPENYRKYMINKEKLHPNFEHKVWSYDDTIKLMKEDNFLCNYISVLEGLDMWICKCDLARLAVIYAKGGVYADLDFDYKKNITNLLHNRKEYFVYEPKQHCDNHGISITNAFFACIPKHKFIKDIIMYISKNRDLKIKNYKDVLFKSGPIALANVYEQGNYDFSIENNCAVMPIDFSGKYSDICVIGQEYALTKWNEGTNWSNDITYDYNYVKPSMFILIIFIIIIVLCIIFISKYKSKYS